MTEVSPAQLLTCEKLEGGWIVGAQLPHNPNAQATGGLFSVGYEVVHENGTQAFLKAIDLSKAIQPNQDAAQAQLDMLTAFRFECAILEKCGNHKMDRIVVALDSGTHTISAQPLVIVPYLIFERADGDIRKHMKMTQHFDAAWMLRSLHHIATGLLQLHTYTIAHNDMKPSNVLVFAQHGAKICDLGRAVALGFSPPHHDLPISGDRSYAPPELLYNQVDPDWKKHRFATDVYQLGSLVMFVFVQAGMTPLLRAELDSDHAWWSGGLPDQSHWTGTYAEVLPYVRAAFNKAMEQFEQSLVAHQMEPKLSEELVALVRTLCEPDPSLRGHPKTRSQGFGNLFSLERYVSQLNRMALEAEVQMKGMHRP